MQLRRLLKPLVPRVAVDFVRSAKVARRLGLVLPWLRSMKSPGKKSCYGTEYGGWTIPNDRLTADSVCYCVGCGEDISFDLELVRAYACTVYGFDPTPRSVEFVRRTTANIPGYRFRDVGIWDRDGTVKFFAPRDSQHVSHSITNLQSTDAYIEVPTRRLREVLRENGHSRLTLLKLDIEGAEYQVFSAADVGSWIRRVKVLIFECPDADRPGTTQKIFEKLGGLDFVCHVHGENFVLIRKDTGWKLESNTYL